MATEASQKGGSATSHVLPVVFPPAYDVQIEDQEWDSNFELDNSPSDSSLPEAYNLQLFLSPEAKTTTMQGMDWTAELIVYAKNHKYDAPPSKRRSLLNFSIFQQLFTPTISALHPVCKSRMTKVEAHQTEAPTASDGPPDIPPPSYDNVQIGDQDLDSKSEPDDGSCDSLPDKYNLWLSFFPDAKITTMEGVDWEAELIVYAKNVQKLMKDGFYWTEANVQKNKGYLLIGRESLPSEIRQDGHWSHARCYQLSDRSSHSTTTGDIQWLATLWVYAHEVSVLSNFRLHDLSVNKIASAHAKNTEGRMIYEFNATLPHSNFNAIYDDKPLKGWWPWPKQS
ncbi:hypothetical protein DCS_02799 [Drechmeria coniospora]|uniref:Uncharacterized protein n=1 Tax=Drechmeria coniospora TaxID=98403 RepID=A0A151GX28_DRECN|nr:hypothetical protein DCS_02799 [Drechmeria coniospora]KYK61656.1 hypothetical protein DCS_02799 [Drechmeria coniospora]